MSVKRKPGRPRHDDILTPAEWRIVNGIRHGLSSREISGRRGISVDAVKYHVANILQKLGFSSRRQLRDWDGVDRFSALAAKETIMTASFTLDKVGQISRTVSDIDKARDWYSETLGLEHLYSFGDLAFFKCNGLRLFLSQGDCKPGEESIIYFVVDDIRSAHRTLGERGVKFTNAPHMVHRHNDGVEEWMAFFEDLEGRPLALMSSEAVTDAG
ncbi:LuxR C-terminal-related transcriptional regulator [Hyphococcus sp.]|uniref:LuxR C-terminal-related transcriptional regulator n=1 Tax=Hyphococcus sp. TaxID=2038636 RepID=UPI003CCC3867